jgi:hypothetical protein
LGEIVAVLESGVFVVCASAGIVPGIVVLRCCYWWEKLDIEERPSHPFRKSGDIPVNVKDRGKVRGL